MAHLLVKEYILANEPLFLVSDQATAAANCPRLTGTSFRLG